MGLIVQTSDFTGIFAIPALNASELDAFINDNEETWLVELFGSLFFDAFKADLVASTHTTRFQTLLNAFRFDLPGNYNRLYWNEGCYCSFENNILLSKGLKHMLKCFVLFYFMREKQLKNTSNGAMVTSPDTAQVGVNDRIIKFYNDGIITHRAVQYYIRMYKAADYSDLTFNGQFKDYIIPMFN